MHSTCIRSRGPRGLQKQNLSVTTTTVAATSTAKGHSQFLLDVGCGITDAIIVPCSSPSAGFAVDVAVAVAAAAAAGCRDGVAVGVLVVAMAAVVLL